MAQATVRTGMDTTIPMTHVRTRSVPNAGHPPPYGGSAPVLGDQERDREMSSLREWLVILGAFIANLLAFGWVTSSAFFFDYYRHHQYAGQSALALSWLSSLGFAFLYCISLPLSKFCSDASFGPRCVMFLGICIDVLAMVLLPLATELYQLLILQGVLSPLGASMVFNASQYTRKINNRKANAQIGITILSKWFRNKATVAIAITSAGGGIGGLCFPFLINQCLQTIDYEATLLVCTAVHTVLLTITYLTVTMPPGSRHEPARASIMKPLRDFQFIITAIGATLFICGYYTTLTFLVTIARARGLTNPSAALAIANGCSVPGRIISGWIAKDRGLYNILIMFTLVAWVLTLALFAQVTSVLALYFYCAFWGFFTAASISLLPAIVFHRSPIPEISVRIGLLYFIMSFGIVAGAPIAAMIPIANDYRALIYSVGGCQILGWCFWVFARCYETGLPSVEIV